MNTSPFPCPGLTADDWGLSRGVNQGILKLAQLKIIRRVSMLAPSTHLTEGLSELLQIEGIETGLHFNLTYGKPLSAQALLAKWLFASRSQKERMRVEFSNALQSQLESLKRHAIPVHYLDSHHHVHLLPGLIRDLSPILRREGIRFVRLPYDPTHWFTPKFPILLLSLLLKRDLNKLGFHYAPSFFYPRLSDFRDPSRLKIKLSALPPDTEILTHPAAFADVHTLSCPDPYSEGRVLEYQTLRRLML